MVLILCYTGIKVGGYQTVLTHDNVFQTFCYVKMKTKIYGRSGTEFCTENSMHLSIYWDCALWVPLLGKSKPFILPHFQLL